MNVITILGIVKCLSALATGVFGTVAVLVEYRRPDGKLTRGGQFAIAGIVLTTSLTLMLQTAESAKAEKDAADANQKMMKLVASIQDVQAEARNGTVETSKVGATTIEVLDSAKQLAEGIESGARAQRALLGLEMGTNRSVLRSSFPLEPLEISFTKKISINDPRLASYANRVKTELDAIDGSAAAELPRRRRRLRDRPVPLPDLAKQEFVARDLLLPGDPIWFHFENGKLTKHFDCIPTKEPQILINRAEEVFIVVVSCGAQKGAGDPAFRSALDLVGAHLSWHVASLDRAGASVVSLTLGLPYESRDVSHSIVIRPEDRRVVLTANAIGLNGVMDGSDVARNPRELAIVQRTND